MSSPAPIRRGDGLALAAAVALVIGLMIPLRGYITDDTFIHLQYARHLAEGEGLVFNVGERVYGCTSPLWVLLLAGGFALGIDGVVWARWLGAAATIATVLLFARLLALTVASPVVRAAGLVSWAGHVWMARWSVSGMETPLVVALVVGGFALRAGAETRPGARAWTGVVWALAAWTRPEAYLLLALWIATEVLAPGPGRASRVRGVLPAALLGAGWLITARIWFGAWWPQTLAAKAAGGEGLAYHADNANRLLQVLAAGDALPFLGVLLALVAGARAAAPRRPADAVPWVWVLGLPALYAMSGVPAISRYLVVVSPVAAWCMWRFLDRRVAAGAARRWKAVAVAVAVAMLAQNLIIYRTRVLEPVLVFSAALERGLVSWGRWFHENTPAGARIAAPDIGALGYHARRPVLDLAGLVTPQMVPWLEREPQAEAVAAFRFAAFARPDYLVDRATRPYRLLEESPFAACLTPLGATTMPNLGVARPEAAVYSFYRIDWTPFDSIAARRADSTTR